MEPGGAASLEPAELRHRLQSMDTFDFEHLIADLWARQGWETEVEQQSGDAGVDVRATKSAPYEQKALIQAKRYSDSNTLGGPDIQQYAALKHQEDNVDKAIVVTTGRFTSAAEERGRDLNVKLVDGDDLIALIEQYDAYDIVEDYVEIDPVDEESVQTGEHAAENDWPGRVPPDTEAKVAELLDGDFQDHIADQRYQATRALEQADSKVKLNPHDAKQLGVFDGLEPLELDIERQWADTQIVVPLLKNDVHLDSDGQIFVGDLTAYVNPAAIAAPHHEHVVGIIERGVSDNAWVRESTVASLLAKMATVTGGPDEPDTVFHQESEEPSPTDTASESSGTDQGEASPESEATTGEPSDTEADVPREVDSKEEAATDRGWLMSFAAGRSNFHYVALGGLLISILSFFIIGLFGSEGGDVSPIVALFALLFITMPFVGFAGLILDLAYINTTDSEWQPSIWAGFLGAIFLWIPYLIYYIYKRHKYVGL